MEFFSIIDGEFLRSEKFDKFVNETSFVFLRNFEKAKELNLNYKQFKEVHKEVVSNLHGILDYNS